MTTALLIMLREGFEAALIVAIVFTYLRRIDRRDLSGSVWLGVGIAAAVSIGVGVAVHTTIGSLAGAARLRAFAGISLLAAGVLTWMIFWMRKQSRMIKSDLEHKVDRALQHDHTGFAMALVAFIAVLREGIEAALFLLAAATESDGAQVLLGGTIGLALASGLAYLVYLGGRKLPMQAFFKVTGIILIVFAAGLVARSVMFLQSAETLGSFNLNGVYDLRSIAWLTQESEVGKFLAAMFGWDPRPSIEQVVLWLAYLVPVLILFLRGGKAPAVAPATATTAASATATTGEAGGATPATATAPSTSATTTGTPAAATATAAGAVASASATARR